MQGLYFLPFQMDADMNQLVFVYGSLKRGLHNHPLIESAKFVFEALTVEPQFRMGNVGPYPEVTRTDTSDGGYLVGEVFHCDPPMMETLDKLEENGVWYQRHQIEVVPFDANRVKTTSTMPHLAWCYFWLKPLCPNVSAAYYLEGIPVYNWQPK